MRLLLLGATGLVGGEVLSQALVRDIVDEVVAPTRRPLRPQTGLTNPVGPQIEQFANRVSAWRVDAIICAVGTTKAKAGSEEAFRHADYSIPLIFAAAGKAADVPAFALVSAIGASTSSRFSYARTKGELERDVERVGFPSLTICRPSIIGGERHETRRAEEVTLALSKLLAPILPKKFHVNPASVIASTLLEAVIGARPGTHWILSEDMN